MIRPWAPIGSRPATRPPGRSPEEALDALVAVLDEVRLGHSQSRSDLVAHTGLVASIVAQRVAELLDRGLVVEGDPGPSTGGRPPRQLTFRADAGHVLVADLGATSHRRRRDRRSTAASWATTTSRPASRTARTSRSTGSRSCSASCWRRRAALPGRIWGIGIGVPGPVEYRTGRPISPPIMPGWDGYPVRERFADRYDAPVWVDNDVNVLALGEWRSGIAAGSRQRRRGQGRDGHRRRDHRRRPAPPRRAGRRPGDVGHIQVVGGSRRRLPVRQHRLPRGAGRRRGDRARRRGGRARGPEPAAARGARPARDGDRRGRRAGRLVRGPGRGRAAPGGGPADRRDARGRRELLQPVAGRHRRRRRAERRRAAGLDPRGGLRALAAARDAGPAHPALVAGRARRA